MSALDTTQIEGIRFMHPKRAPRHQLPELYMKLIDLKRLLRLMAVQSVSQRGLAKAAGYASHTYMGKLMRGEVDTLEPEAALRIARHLGVGVDDLFMPRLSTDAGSSVGRRPKVPA
jgi:hypothetical protein